MTLDYFTVEGRQFIPEPTRPAGEWMVTRHDIQTPPRYIPRVLNCVEYSSFCRDGEPVRLSDGSLKYPGAPEMVRAFSGNMCQMGERWQWFLLRLIVFGKHGHYDESKLTSAQLYEVKRDFNYLYGGGLAWANNAGSNTNANYIWGTNLDKDPIKVMAGTCGGHLLKVTGRATHGMTNYVRCEALNALENPPDIHLVNPQTKPWLFTVSVISRYDYHVIAFPRSYPLYVPFMDRIDVMEIEERRTRPLMDYENFPPSPYVS